MSRILSLVVAMAVGALYCYWLASCGGSGRIYQPPLNQPPKQPGQQWQHGEIRPYTDPVTHQTYDIIEGFVIVRFKVDTASPEVETFIQQTGVTVVSEWPATQSMAFELPQGVTVEYAVQNWPSMYADVVASVSPDSAGQTGQ